MYLFKKKGSLGSILIEAGVLSERDLRIALESQEVSGEPLGKILKDLGYISQADLSMGLAKQAGLNFLTLQDFPANPPSIPKLSSRYLKRHVCFPLELNGNTLHLVVPDPFSISFADDIRRSLGFECRFSVATAEDILEALDLFYNVSGTSMEKIIASISEDDLVLLGANELEDIDQLRDMASEAPVIQLVNYFISKAVELGATDVHIEPMERELKVRCRVDGMLQELETPPKKLQAAIISRIKIMGELNIAERRLPQDGSTRLRVSGKEFDIRINTVPTQYGESVAMRLLDRSGIFLDLKELGLGEENRTILEKIIAKPNGILLVTGPTGSGKTTTLYAALSMVNTVDRKIITVEDPVEYQLPGINQIEVKEEIGLTFSKGLRSLVRQDPDIMLIGEIRDQESAEIAIQSALTGHLVFSTLHTNDAPSTIVRLIDIGIEPYLIASTLEGVLAQRLVRKICQHCRVERKVSGEALLASGFRVAPEKEYTIYEGEGCEKCGGTGYSGRTGIFEFLPINREMRELIEKKISSSEIRVTALNMGMKTLRDDGLEKILSGITTVAEVLLRTQEEEE